MGERTRKWISFGAGLVVGVVLMAAALGALLVRKGWNTGAVRASFDEMVGWQDGERFLGLAYEIENTTASDYRLPADASILLVRGGALVETAAYRLAGPVTVRGGETARCTITAPKSREVDRQVDGFLILDATSHYAIVFPKPFGPRLERQQPNRL